MPKKVMRDQMQLRMEPTLVDAVRVYADQVRERTGVRTVSVAEATRMAIRAGLVAAGIDPDAPANVLVPEPLERAVRDYASGVRVRRSPDEAWGEFLRQNAQAGEWLTQSEIVVREATRRLFDRAIERANRSAPDAGEAPDLSGVSTEDQPSDHEALRAFDPREGLKAFKGDPDPLTSRPRGGRRE